MVTEERSCAPEIFYMDFYRFYLISTESKDLLGFYCRASIVYNVMLLTLILRLSNSKIFERPFLESCDFANSQTCTFMSMAEVLFRKIIFKL